MNNQDHQELNNEASVGIYISSFLGTVALFFAGILMSRLAIVEESLKMPILFLVVSTFAFVFSAIIYANMTGAKRLAMTNGKNYIQLGNVLSEYLGLYPFIASVPMVVSAITTDNFLRISTLTVTLTSLFIYTISSFSMARRAFKKVDIVVFSLLITTSPFIGFITQHSNNTLFVANGVIFLAILGVTTLIHSDKV